MSSIENSTVEGLLGYGPIVGIFTLFYCIPGFVVVTALIHAEVKYNNFKTKPFNILIVNSLIADIMFLILYILYAAPCDIFVANVYGVSARFLAGFCEAYVFTVSLYTNVVITINRFISIFFPKAADRIFDKRGTNFLALATWIAPIISIALLDVWLKGCVFFFDERQFIFYATCDVNKSSVWLPAIPLISLGIMGLLYLMCLMKLKAENSKVGNETIAQNMAKKRMKVFWQAFGIWASMLLNVISYHFISPYMQHLLINGIVSLILTLCPTYGSSVIILIFDKKVRQCLKSMYQSNNVDVQMTVYGVSTRFLAGFCEAYVFTVSLYTNVVITINRFISIFFPKAADRLFDKRGTNFVALATWIVAILSIVLLDVWLKGCVFFFDERQFIFYATCDVNKSSVWLPAIPLISLGIMGVLYLMCLLKLKVENSKVGNETIAQNMAKKRMKVFWQAFGIWASMLLNVISYHFISPYMQHILINGIVSLILTLCPTYGSSVIILIFDKKVRQCLKSMYKSNNVDVQMTTTNIAR